MSLQQIAKRLLGNNLPHTVVANQVVVATDFKVTTKLKFPEADVLMIDRMEGTQLRGRSMIEDPTKTKILNAIKRVLTRGMMPWETEGQHNRFTFIKHGQQPKHTGPISLSDIHQNETRTSLYLCLVDENNKPVTTKAQVSGELRLVDCPKIVTATLSKEPKKAKGVIEIPNNVEKFAYDAILGAKMLYLFPNTSDAKILVKYNTHKRVNEFYVQHLQTLGSKFNDLASLNGKPMLLRYDKETKRFYVGTDDAPYVAKDADVIKKLTKFLKYCGFKFIVTTNEADADGYISDFDNYTPPPPVRRVGPQRKKTSSTGQAGKEVLLFLANAPGGRKWKEVYEFCEDDSYMSKAMDLLLHHGLIQKIEGVKHTILKITEKGKDFIGR